jgi:hypothetical protein
VEQTVFHFLKQYNNHPYYFSTYYIKTKMISIILIIYLFDFVVSDNLSSDFVCLICFDLFSQPQPQPQPQHQHYSFVQLHLDILIQSIVNGLVGLGNKCVLKLSQKISLSSNAF